jgi:hypothetical protein
MEESTIRKWEKEAGVNGRSGSSEGRVESGWITELASLYVPSIAALMDSMKW